MIIVEKNLFASIKSVWIMSITSVQKFVKELIKSSIIRIGSLVLCVAL